MALAIVHTRAQLGIEAPPVAVEVHLSGGLPSFALSVMGGMPETWGKESNKPIFRGLLKIRS